MTAWNITIETMLALAGMGAALWMQSVRFARLVEVHAQRIAGLGREISDLRHDVDELDTRDRAQSAANAAAAHLYQTQLAEFREHVAQAYATKRELEGIESRLMSTLDRMAGRIETMDSKLDDLRDRLPGRGGYPAS